jgi:hypothetical protein
MKLGAGVKNKSGQTACHMAGGGSKLEVLDRQ